MIRRTVLLVFGMLCLAAAASPVVAQDDDEQWEGRKAPDFSLQDTEGKPVRLSDYMGKKVIWLNFWGLRCGPCVRELPALQKLYAKYAPKGLVIVGINTDGVNADFVKKAFADRADLKSAGVTFPLACDEEFSVLDAYGLAGAPLNVMIDKKGVIRFRHEGYEPGDETGYAKTVDKLLAE